MVAIGLVMGLAGTRKCNALLKFIYNVCLQALMNVGYACTITYKFIDCSWTVVNLMAAIKKVHNSLKRTSQHNLLALALYHLNTNQFLQLTFYTLYDDGVLFYPTYLPFIFKSL